MDLTAPWHLYLMSVLYIITGVLHFVNPRMYIKIMPPYIPAAKFMVYLSGASEILLGLALWFSALRAMALWGIILMLLVFFPVHIYMIQEKKFLKKFPRWLLLSRIPIQFVLMYWAYQYIA